MIIYSYKQDTSIGADFVFSIRQRLHVIVIYHYTTSSSPLDRTFKALVHGYYKRGGEIRKRERERLLHQWHMNRLHLLLSRVCLVCIIYQGGSCLSLSFHIAKPLGEPIAPISLQAPLLLLLQLPPVYTWYAKKCTYSRTLLYIMYRRVSGIRRYKVYLLLL